MLVAHGVGPLVRHGGRRVVELEPQLSEDVAITQHGVAQGRSLGSSLPDELPLLGMLLVDMGHRNAVEPHDMAERFGTHDAVDVGEPVDAQLARLVGGFPHAHQRMMPPLGVDFQEIDAQPVEERTEQARRGNRDPQLGVGRTQGAQGVRQHGHVAHRRSADHQQMPRRMRVIFCHRVPG